MTYKQERLLIKLIIAIAKELDVPIYMDEKDNKQQNDN